MQPEKGIKRDSLQHAIIQRIKNIIIENDLKPGYRLATEQELADQFEVSRISIREATRSLAFMGIINSSPRLGLIVGNFDMERVSDILGFHWALSNQSAEELIKSRMVIELGALQFTMEAMRKSREIYDRLRTLADHILEDTQPMTFIDNDIAFHRELVNASGIEPIVAFTDVLHAFFHRFRTGILKHREIDQVMHHHEVVELLWKDGLEEAEKLLRFYLSTFLGAIEE